MTDEELKDLGRKVAQLDEMQKAKLETIAKQAGSGIKRKTYEEIISKLSVGQEGKTVDFEETTRLDETGGISHETRTNIRFYDCGHPSKGAQNLGGRCQIPGCNRTFCNTISGNKPLCYRKCIACHKMLCMKHAHAYGSSGEIFCGPICYIKKILGLVK